MHNLPVFAGQPDRIFCLDGGTGSELERRGSIMSDKCWSGKAGFENPVILEEIHTDYLDNGAEIIICNTFATSSISLETEKLSPEVVHRINDDACKIAMKVKNAANKPVAVAGSISHSIPYQPWNGKLICGMTPDHITQEAYVGSIKQQVKIFEANKVDVIFIEECYEPDRTKWNLKACQGSALPVWVGISCKEVDGVIVTARHENLYPLADLVDVILEYKSGVQAIGIMHTPAAIVQRCLEILQAKWSGPTYCYPEIGEYHPPHWVCVRLEQKVWADYVNTWAQMGCSMIGGCCGVMPDDIRIVADIIEGINDKQGKATVKDGAC
jgi:homocysteine S-methyltransferase